MPDGASKMTNPSDEELIEQLERNGAQLCSPTAGMFPSGELMIKAAERIRTLAAEREEAVREAVNLATCLHRWFYADVTQWKPLDDPAGVIMQIDNMVAGIMAQHDALQSRLLKAVEELKEIAARAYSEPLPDAYAAEPPTWAQDPFNDNSACSCGYCGSWMSVVRPGKTQCDTCSDGQDVGAVARALLQSIEAESGGEVDEPSLRPSGEAEGLLTKNPAPNASPIAAPTGRYAEFTVSAHPTPAEEAE